MKNRGSDSDNSSDKDEVAYKFSIAMNNSLSGILGDSFFSLQRYVERIDNFSSNDFKRYQYNTVILPKRITKIVDTFGREINMGYQQAQWSTAPLP